MPDPWQSRVIPWDECDEERRVMLRQAWTDGNLRYKLDDDQRRVYDDIKGTVDTPGSWQTATDSFDRRYILDISRRWGKDYLMAVIALESQQTAENGRIVYGAAYQTDVRKILEPIFEDILKDCPPELRPEYRRGDCRWTHKNGTNLDLVGCDLYPQRLRGPSATAVFLTEMAFMGNIEDGIMAALMPQVLTNPDAYQIFASTPPETPVHPWSTKYVPEGKERGFYSFRDIDDCPRLTETQKAGAIKEAGGIESTRCQREYYCKHVTEETRAIIPEWKTVREQCIIAMPRPPHADCYDALDPGWSHFCAGLFAYWDFGADTLYIEGEFGEARKNSRQISHIIAARHWQLWGTEPWRDKRFTDEAWQAELVLIRDHFYPDLPDPEETDTKWERWEPTGKRFRPQPYLAVSDTDMRMLADLQAEHGLVFAPTAKDDRDAAINGLRLRIQAEKIKCHPRCVGLISDLDHGTWNKQKTKFAESSNEGHFDRLAALVYLDRNVDRMRNPCPPPTMGISGHDHAIDPAMVMTESKTVKTIKRAAMGPTRRRNADRRAGR